MKRFVAVIITLSLLIGCVYGVTYQLFAQDAQGGLPPLDWTQQEPDGSSDIVTEDSGSSSVPPTDEQSSEPASEDGKSSESAPKDSSGESGEEEQLDSPLLLQEPVFQPMDASGSGLAVQQNVSLNPEAASATTGTNVDVNLQVSAAINHFYNVTLEYEIPAAMDFVSIDSSASIKTITYYNASDVELGGPSSAVKRMVLTLESKNPSTRPDGEFSAGSSVDISINLRFPTPSRLPNGTQVTLYAAQLSGNIGDAGGEAVQAESGRPVIEYALAKSWRLEKTGPASITISNNSAQTSIDATYTIRLYGGNIPLKNVRIEDTLPANATFVSSTASVAADVSVPGKLSWNFEDVPTTGVSFTVRLRYAISRSGSAGVMAGDTAINAIVVTGNPVLMQEDGEYVEYTDAQGDPFINKTAQCSTQFVQSTARWKVELTGPATVTLSQNPTLTQVIAGNYTATISGGDVPLANGVMVVTLPDDAEVIEGNYNGGVWNAANRTVTWSGIALVDGASYSKTLSLRYPIKYGVSGSAADGVWDGSERDHTVSATATDPDDEDVPIEFVPSSDNQLTRFVLSTNRWTVSKTLSGTPAAINHEDGGEGNGNDYVEVSYNLSLTGTAYTIPLKNVVIVDTLPQYAEYQSDTSGITPVQATENDVTTLTWSFADITASKSFTVTVRYPIDRAEGTGYIPGNTVVNHLKVTADKINSDGNADGAYAFSGGGEVTHSYKFVPAAVANPTTSINVRRESSGVYPKNATTKLLTDKHHDVGDTLTYQVNVTNPGVEHLITPVITVENLPSITDYSTLVLGRNTSHSIAYELFFTTNGTDWTEYTALGALSTGTSGSIDLAAAGLSGIRGIRFAFTQNLPAGFTFTQPVTLTGTVNGDAQNETNYFADVKMDYKYRQFETQSLAQRSDRVGIRILWDRAWISTLTKARVTVPSGGGFQTNSEVTYRVTVTNHVDLGTRNLLNPVLVDVLPEGFIYGEITAYSSSLAAAGLAQPETTLRKDYPTQGQTAVYWSWDEGSVLKMGETVTLEYKARIESHTGVGTHYNYLYLYAGDEFRYTTPALSMVEDTDSLAPEETFGLLRAEPCATVVRETAVSQSVLWVKGELDEAYSNRPAVGQTVPGGIADYLLEVRNASNVYVQTIELLDIFPYGGDTNITIGGSRGSTWGPYLISPIQAGDLEIVEDVYGNRSEATLQVYYSTATNPIRKSQSGAMIGTQEPNWSEQPPADMSSVRSVRFVISGFTENGQNGAHDMLLKPGSKITLSWKMRTPVDTPPNQEAWNSISQITRYFNTGGNMVEMLPAEPPPVGIEVQTSTKGEIGSRVWLDDNKNGIRDEGEQGVNGVPTTLYQRVGSAWQAVATTMTGNTADGAGYYLFPHLDPGQYYVAFSLTGLGYEATLPLVGNDPTVDSNGKMVAGVLRTDTITLAEGQSVRTIDQGVNSARFLITKTANRTFFTYAGSVIEYTITVFNNGPTPLTAVTVRDALIELDEEIAVLPVGESRTFTGSYTTTPSDVQNKRVDNTATADSNETDEITASRTVSYRRPSSGGEPTGETGSERPLIPETGGSQMPLGDDELSLHNFDRSERVWQAKLSHLFNSLSTLFCF